MSILRWAVSLVPVLALGTTGTVLAQHWSYEGEPGPQNWAQLDAKFSVCASVKNQ